MCFLYCLSNVPTGSKTADKEYGLINISFVLQQIVDRSAHTDVLFGVPFFHTLEVHPIDLLCNELVDLSVNWAEDFVQSISVISISSRLFELLRYQQTLSE